jgi:hypothetical protein
MSKKAGHWGFWAGWSSKSGTIPLKSVQIDKRKRQSSIKQDRINDHKTNLQKSPPFYIKPAPKDIEWKFSSLTNILRVFQVP